MTHVLIAGAGIGGLTSALALARSGAAVTLIERAPHLEEAGAGLQLSPNATRVLRQLGVLDALRPDAGTPDGIEVRAGRTAARLSTLPLAGAEARWGAPYLVAHRADLQRVLVAAVAAEPAIVLHRGAALAGFGITPAGVTIIVKQDRLTRSFEADALIGADGVHSAVRARLVTGADDRPRETGRTAWRALVPAAAVPALFDSNHTGLWLGRDAHLVHYRLRGGRLVNIVAILHGSGAASAPEDLWRSPGDPAIIAAAFGRWHPAVRRLIEAAPDWQRWPLFDRAPLAAWNAGPVALLGDAAHPILPFLAQGAAQAIEDAAALAAAIQGKASSIDARLAAYSAGRQARAVRVQDAARQLGRIYHLAGPAAVARNIAMKTMGAGRLLARYDWLYGHGAPETMAS